MTAADHANTVRYGLHRLSERGGPIPSRELAALDALAALAAQAEEGANWKASCARYLANKQAAEAERDAAVQAAEQARAALQQIADIERWEQAGPLIDIARAALAGNQP